MRAMTLREVMGRLRNVQSPVAVFRFSPARDAFGLMYRNTVACERQLQTFESGVCYMTTVNPGEWATRDLEAELRSGG